MAFTKSTVSTTNISDLPNKPLISPTALKTKFDEYGANDKSYINGLIDELEKTTATSGAENIGSRTIAGISGNTVWAQLQSLYNQIVTVVLGQIPNDSLTNSKLSSDIKIGSNATLETNVKTNIVSAINEVNTISKSASCKNKLINGNFAVNQRAVTGTVILAAGAYGHDRWKAGTSGCTYTFSTSNNITTITIATGSLRQIIEGVNLQSGTHCLSWTGTCQGKIDGGSYSLTGVTATATGGTDLIVEFNTGTLSKVQFEPGSYPTTFENLVFSTELEICKRYFEKSYNYNTVIGANTPNGREVSKTDVAIAINTAGTLLFYRKVKYDVKKRTTPTVILYGRAATNPVNTIYKASQGANRTGCTVYSPTQSESGFDGISIDNSSGSVSFAIGDEINFHYTADAEL